IDKKGTTDASETLERSSTAPSARTDPRRHARLSDLSGGRRSVQHLYPGATSAVRHAGRRAYRPIAGAGRLAPDARVQYIDCQGHTHLVLTSVKDSMKSHDGTASKRRCLASSKARSTLWLDWKSHCWARFASHLMDMP